METMFDTYMIISMLLIIISVVSIYIILCRLRYREKVIIQREKQLDKEELWLGNK